MQILHFERGHAITALVTPENDSLTNRLSLRFAQLSFKLLLSTESAYKTYVLNLYERYPNDHLVRPRIDVWRRKWRLAGAVLKDNQLRKPAAHAQCGQAGQRP